MLFNDFYPETFKKEFVKNVDATCTTNEFNAKTFEHYMLFEHFHTMTTQKSMCVA